MRDGSFCPNCHMVGQPKTKTPGSFLIEVVLWLCFIVPGVLYSLWRLAARKQVCAYCSSPGLIPADSPRAQQLSQQ